MSLIREFQDQPYKINQNILTHRLDLLWEPKKEKNGQITALFSIIIKCTITTLFPTYGDNSYISIVHFLALQQTIPQLRWGIV